MLTSKKTLTKANTSQQTFKHLLTSFSIVFLLVTNVSSAQAITTRDGCEHPFWDVEGISHEDEICHLYQDGVIQGFADRSFLPNHYITRAEFLKVAILSMGYQVTASVKHDVFSDVEAGDWHYRYITFARQKGWIKGYPDGTFRPNHTITRAEAVTLMMNMAGLLGPNPSFNSKYFDVSNTDWFGFAVYAAEEREFLDIFDTFFRPNYLLRRAEAAVIVDRVKEALEK